MFRRKQRAGNVTVFEEDPNDDGASSDTPASPEDAVDEEDLLNAAKEGLTGTGRALHIANEALGTGVATAETLGNQTTQLQGINKNLGDVQDNLDESDYVLDKMTKWKVFRMVKRKKKTNKKNARRHGKEAVDVDAGVGALDLDDMSGGARRRGKKKGESDNSGLPTTVAQVVDQQDENLDELADVLGKLNAVAGAMNSELDIQNKLIDDVQEGTQQTRERTKNQKSRLEKIK